MDFPTLLDKTSQALLTVLDNTKSEQFDDPTPCQDWSVKQLMNHLIGSCKFFKARALGVEPEPRLEIYSEDFEEAKSMLESEAREVVKAWNKPGVLEKTVQAPMGEVSGEFLAGITANEFLTHGWDLAKATNQKLVIDEEVAAKALELAQQRMTPETRGRAFGEEIEVSADAPPLDRLIAFLGRRP